MVTRACVRMWACEGVCVCECMCAGDPRHECKGVCVQVCVGVSLSDIVNIHLSFGWLKPIVDR